MLSLLVYQDYFLEQRYSIFSYLLIHKLIKKVSILKKTVGLIGVLITIKTNYNSLINILPLFLFSILRHALGCCNTQFEYFYSRGKIVDLTAIL